MEIERTKSDRMLIVVGERKLDRGRQAGNEPQRRRRVAHDLYRVVSGSTEMWIRVLLERRASPKSLEKTLWQVFVVCHRDDHSAALTGLLCEVLVELFIGVGYNITGQNFAGCLTRGSHLVLAEGSAGRTLAIKALGSGESVENCIGIGARYTGKGGWAGSRTEGRFCISVVLRCEGAAMLRCCDAPNLGEQGCKGGWWCLSSGSI